MQHLDEGTIHSWLDGALAPDEAARVEAHVAECPECASAVAEARGFIAASSRILTKLDDVPSGVVPVARPVRRRNFAAWQAAAAVLVVAVGSLVVLKNRDSEQPTVTSQRAAAAGMVMSDTGQGDARLETVEPQAAVVPGTAPVGATNRPTLAPIAKAMPAPPRDERRSDHPATGGAVGEAAQTNSVAAGTAAPSPAVVPAAPFAADARTESPLRLVKEEKSIGGTRTVYTVAAGDTVTLFEQSTTRLESVVTTGVAAASPRREMPAPTVTELNAKAATVAADTAALLGRTADATAQSRAAKSASVLPAAPPPAQAKPVRTISWTDPASGRTLTLSGRLPVDQLEDIKRRIERERAAAATARKPAR